MRPRLVHLRAWAKPFQRKEREERKAAEFNGVPGAPCEPRSGDQGASLQSLETAIGLDDRSPPGGAGAAGA